MLLGVALTAGISLIGPAMAMLNDELTIWETVTTGTLTEEVLFTEVYVEDNTWLFQGGNWGISSRIDSADGKMNHQIALDLGQANYRTNWVVNSKIENRGTIPVRFLAPTVIVDNNVFDVAYDLPNEVIEPGKKGLDPGDSVEGKIRITRKNDVPGIYPFQIEVKCIQWNAYNEDPGWWTDTLHINGTVEVLPPESY